MIPAGIEVGYLENSVGGNNQFSLFAQIARQQEEVILSTGMCTMQHISEAIAVLETYGVRREQITVLHCNTEYPTAMKDVNLLAMDTIRKVCKR